MRTCCNPSCGKVLAQRRNERPVNFRHRRFCSKQCGYKWRDSIANILFEDSPEPEAKQDWLDGVSFSGDDPGDGGFWRMPRPETHVHYQSGSGWAVRT
jgi:hypothetical protein